MDHWERERSGLTGTCLSYAENIVPFEDGRDGFGLDRRRDGISLFGDGLLDRSGKGKG